MKVLDLDMDYFMEHIACIPFSVSELEKMEKSLFSMGTHMMNLKILL